MPKIIEKPDLIRCEYAERNGWPTTFRLGAQVCKDCDRLRCRFHSAPPGPRHIAMETHEAQTGQPRATGETRPHASIPENLERQPQKLTSREVLRRFPSSSLRPYQKETIERIVEAFNSGRKCVILTAPTGFGKSYVNSSFASVTRSFYATLQLALIDQMLRDTSLRSRFVEIKGRRNYSCYHAPHRSGAGPVLSARNWLFLIADSLLAGLPTLMPR